jgi:kumamolisin
MTAINLVPIPGSQRLQVRNAKLVGPARGDERMEVTVRLRRKAPLAPSAIDGRQKPSQRTYLTHDELNAAHGAVPAELAKVEAYGRQCGLVVVESSAARRSVVLSGTVSDFNKAFGVTLQNWEHAGGTYRGRTGHVHIPKDLEGIISGVFGLDNRIFARPHFRRLHPSANAAGTPFAGFKPTDVAGFYNFPSGVDGSGQVVGIIELGGGYRPEDLSAYARQIGVPAPKVRAVSVDNGRNAPSTVQSADGEVMLDIEVVASIAPGAAIVVYFAAGATDRDFLDAISQAVHDAANNPGVISISWGGPESSATASFQTAFDDVLQSAAALGITVTVASGDSGAADEGPNDWDGTVHVDFPASSPNALACGATNIQVANGAITREQVWNQNSADTQDNSFGASGGGISTVFPVPAYQSAAQLPVNVSTQKAGRGVPDVSGNGDPASGYLVRVDGQEFPIGGTSAVAPLWAGLITLVNQKLGHRSGFINPILYANPGALRDVTQGSNRVGAQELGYAAGPGWDACTGLGSPDGQKLLSVLASS